MKKSELRKLIREELMKEWDIGIDGYTKKELQDLLINKYNFNKRKIRNMSEDSLSVTWDILKRKGRIDKEDFKKE